MVYSTTKHIDGQGRALGGAILGSDDFFANDLVPFMRTTGPVMSPFNAWVMLKGLETLELRSTRMCETAARLAAYLESHPAVATVHYPGLPSHPQHALAARQMSRGGSVIAFDLAGGWDAAFRFLDALKLIDISNNLGDAKSLATHPPSTTHQKIGADARATLGIGDGLVRLSVGLEAESDYEPIWSMPCRRPLVADRSCNTRRQAELPPTAISCSATGGTGLGFLASR